MNSNPWTEELASTNNEYLDLIFLYLNQGVIGLVCRYFLLFILFFFELMLGFGCYRSLSIVANWKRKLIYNEEPWIIKQFNYIYFYWSVIILQIYLPASTLSMIPNFSYSQTHSYTTNNLHSLVSFVMHYSLRISNLNRRVHLKANPKVKLIWLQLRL